MEKIKFEDPIVNEIRVAREKIASKLNYDIHRLFSLWRELEKEHSDRLVVTNHDSKQPEIPGKTFPVGQ